MLDNMITVNATRWHSREFIDGPGYITADCTTVCINGKELYYREAPAEYDALVSTVNSGARITREYVHSLFDKYAALEWFANEWEVYIEDKYTPEARYLVVVFHDETGEYIVQPVKPVCDYLGIATGDYMFLDHSSASGEYIETLPRAPFNSVRDSILAIVRRECMNAAKVRA